MHKLNLHNGKGMRTGWAKLLVLPIFSAGLQAQAQLPLRVAIIGLAHGHVAGFLTGGALVPAGGALHRSDVQIVGISDPDAALFKAYANRYHLSPKLYYSSVEAMLSEAHPEAALVFTSTFDHTAAVEACARHSVHVMMEKPIAVSYKDARAMAAAAQASKIHVMVDYETTWYASNQAAHDLLQEGALGEVRKVVVRDGHLGPVKIHVQPEFLAWLTDPKLNGAGALYDFGCYGADLMTWLMHGEAPLTVTAVTQHLQPDLYPKVDDEANMILTYPKAIALVQGSWNWPFDIKNMDVFGRTGDIKTILRDQVEVRKEGQKSSQISTADPVPAPYDDPLHYLTAVIRGQVSEDDTPSSLKINLVVAEILDAARRSAQTGESVKLPLHE
jgi:predicted dehydrogenase